MDNITTAFDRITIASAKYRKPLIVKTTKMFGDVLHGSIIVRHFRHQNADMPIIWAVSEKYVEPLKYYKYATEIVGLPHDMTLEDRQTLNKQMRRNFHHIISPCVGVSGWRIIGSIADQCFYNAGIKKLEVPRCPVLPLGAEDYEWANHFITKHNLKRYICMEYNSFSFERKTKGGIWPLEYYEEFLATTKYPVIWLAHPEAAAFKNGIDGRNTTWRQAAALIKNASLFLGSGSGLTMVAATEGIETPIMEVNIGESVTMKGCGYKKSIDLHKQKPKTLVDEVNRFFKA